MGMWQNVAENIPETPDNMSKIGSESVFCCYASFSAQRHLKRQLKTRANIFVWEEKINMQSKMYK